MARQAVFVTGDKAIDRKLAKLEAKAINKLLPKAAKEAAQVTKEDYRRRVPVDSGAMRDAITTKVRRYNHKANTGQTIVRNGRKINVKRVVAKDIGARVIIDRKRLAKEAGKKKRGKRSLPIDRKRGGMYFYPAVVELGGRKRNGRRPLTKALYQNEQDIKREFIQAMRRLVTGAA